MTDQLVQVLMGNFFCLKKKLCKALFSLRKKQKIEYNCKIKVLQINAMHQKYKLLKVQLYLKTQNEIIY